MTAGSTDSKPLAIQVIRPDLCENRTADEQAMNEIGELLGYTVGKVVEIVPSVEGPLVTVTDALASEKAEAVITSPLWHRPLAARRGAADQCRERKDSPAGGPLAGNRNGRGPGMSTNGPWIHVSACAVAAIDSSTGRILKVGCPSRLCPLGQLVPLDEHGRIMPHLGVVPGDCPFNGYRVVLDPGVKTSPRREVSS